MISDWESSGEPMFYEVDWAHAFVLPVTAEQTYRAR